MDRFDQKGMLIIPNQQSPAPNRKNILVVQQCYCPAGHSLMAPRASFDGNPGILVGVRLEKQQGHIFLSSVYGDKTRVSFDIDLSAGEIVELTCSTCGVTLPTHSLCDCGGSFQTLFLNPQGNFADVIGICNRLGCRNAKIISSGEMITNTHLQPLLEPFSNGQ